MACGATTTPSTAPAENRYRHRLVDGQSIGAGPGLYCEKCGMREGAPGYERICGQEIQLPRGVKSEYDPLA